MSAARRARALAAAALALAVAACALPRAMFLPAEPFRVSLVADEGDPARRASTGLVIRGLEADAAARPATALQLYERSLQVDPTNPWAYLALARHHVESTAPQATLPVLDQAEVLLRRGEQLTPGVEAHLVGLRGEALLATGHRAEGAPLLRRARELAPAVWSDGRLDAHELR